MTNKSTLPITNDPVARIRALVKLIQDMSGMLRGQNDLLTQRGMHLPTAPLESLSTLGHDLNVVMQHLSTGGEDPDIEIQHLLELVRTTEIINSSMDLDHVLSDVIDTVIALTSAERGYIVLTDPDTGALNYKVARSYQQSDLRGNDLIISRTVVEKVVATGSPMLTTNAQQDSRLDNSQSVADYNLRSILCVPLIHKSRVIGVIYMDNRKLTQIFSDREQRLVLAFANQAAIAIENARLFAQVRANLAEITALRDYMDNVLASIASGVITANSEDLVVTLNNAAARILAIQREHSIGRELFTVLPPLYEGFEALIAEVREHDRQQVVETEPVIEERGQISLNLKLSPFKDAQQQTQGVALVLDDLTELRQRQAQLSIVRRYLPPAMVDNIKTIDELELGGVEREISVVFSDVRGFTRFSESLAPDELMTVINRYLSTSTEAIHLFEGIVDKYMGDAVIGLYNTQLNPQEDHALRAVRAALLMANDVRALHEVLPPTYRLFYGIGVHTGSAVLGNVGSPRRKEFTAIGEALQFAKLLQENAHEGEVLVSEVTYQLMKDRIVAEPIEPRKSAGYPNFTIMYSVSSIV